MAIDFSNKRKAAIQLLHTSSIVRRSDTNKIDPPPSPYGFVSNWSTKKYVILITNDGLSKPFWVFVRNNSKRVSRL